MFIRSSKYITAGICGILGTGTVFCKVIDADTGTQSPADLSNTNGNLPEELRLKQVQIFVRHGARTPLHCVRNVQEISYDPLLLGNVPHTMFNHEVQELNGRPRPFSKYDHYYATKAGLLKGGAIKGTLTKYGQHQMYLKGCDLRKQYIEELGFIDDLYDPDQVFIRSTNINRTINTARCVAAGMYGNGNLNKLKDPLVIHVEQNVEDALIPQSSVCSVLRNINHRAMIHSHDMPGLREDRMEMEDVLGIIEPVDDVKKHYKINFVDIRDDIVARETHGLQPIGRLQQYRPMIEKNASTVIYFAFCGSHQVERQVAQQLSSGPLLNMLIKNIKKVGQTKTKFYLYACHDSTLVGLLGTLGVYDFIWPPFGADVRFEVYENSKGQKFVKTIYEGKAMKVEGCSSELCPFEEFETALKPYTITHKQFREICDSDILQVIEKEIMEAEQGEEEDEETQERSDTPAGM